MFLFTISVSRTYPKMEMYSWDVRLNEKIILDKPQFRKRIQSFWFLITLSCHQMSDFGYSRENMSSLVIVLALVLFQAFCDGAPGRASVPLRRFSDYSPLSKEYRVEKRTGSYSAVVILLWLYSCKLWRKSRSCFALKWTKTPVFKPTMPSVLFTRTHRR